MKRSMALTTVTSITVVGMGGGRSPLGIN